MNQDTVEVPGMQDEREVILVLRHYTPQQVADKSLQAPLGVSIKVGDSSYNFLVDYWDLLRGINEVLSLRRFNLKPIAYELGQNMFSIQDPRDGDALTVVLGNQTFRFSLRDMNSGMSVILPLYQDLDSDQEN